MAEDAAGDKTEEEIKAEEKVEVLKPYCNHSVLLEPTVGIVDYGRRAF